jgi:hypothetical protein
VASVTQWEIPTSALAVAAAVLAVVLAVAVIVEIASSGVRSLPPQVGSVAPQPLGNGQYRFYPRSGHADLGVRYRFQLYTHCGLDAPTAMDIDGSFWDPVSPGLTLNGRGNPPDGYGNPYDQGTVTLISPTRAQYRSRTGMVSQWSRHAGPQIGSPCS